MKCISIFFKNLPKGTNTHIKNSSSICSLFKKEQGVVHNTVALAFTLKMYLKAKEEELWKLRYFMKQKIHLIFKKKNQKSFKTLL
jgi:hypothetical protein